MKYFSYFRQEELTMKQNEKQLKKSITIYLLFMTAACTGALIWQFFLPGLAESFSAWGCSPGWQREIALWNVGIIMGILTAVIKQNMACMKVMLIQSAALCWLLGINHFLTLLSHVSSRYIIHVLGVFEVMILGGVWGTALLLQLKKHINSPAEQLTSLPSNSGQERSL